MKYRVKCDLAFENEGEARGLYEVLKARSKFAVLLDAREPKRIEIHKCYHDEAVMRPCEPMEKEEETLGSASG